MSEIEKAKQLIQDEKNKRESECVAELEKLLTKFNCNLLTDVEVVINGKLVVPMVKAIL